MVAQVAHLLHVPRERQHAEPVEEADQPRGPVGAVHVHHVDPELGEMGRVALERDVDVAAPDRVHEVRRGARAARASPGAASFDEQSQRRSTAPAAAGPRRRAPCRPRGRTCRATARSRCRARRRDRPTGARRARRGRRRWTGRPGGGASPGGRRRRGRGRPRRRPTTGRRTPGPGRPARSASAEGREGVLGLVGAGAPVGEGEGGVTALIVTDATAVAPVSSALAVVPMPWQVGHELLGGGSGMTRQSPMPGVRGRAAADRRPHGAGLQ